MEECVDCDEEWEDLDEDISEESDMENETQSIESANNIETEIADTDMTSNLDGGQSLKEFFEIEEIERIFPPLDGTAFYSHM